MPTDDPDPQPEPETEEPEGDLDDLPRPIGRKTSYGPSSQRRFGTIPGWVERV